MAADLLVHPTEDLVVAPAARLLEIERDHLELPQENELRPRGDLRPQIDPKWALRWQDFAVVALFSAIYLLVSYLPLHHAVTWRHVAIGKAILTAGRLPSHEPHLPLAEGIDTPTHGWLSQVVMAKAFELQQGQGVATLLALVTTASLTLAAAMAFARSGRRRFAMLAAVCIVAVMWPWLTMARPEIFGFLCFAMLLLITNSLERNSQTPTWCWLFVPALFVLWANLDGTVILGVAFLGLLALGRCVDSWRDHERLMEAFRDRRVQSTVYLAELAFAASLLQPHGFALWTPAIGVLRPLVLTSSLGLACGVIWLMSAILLRLSPRRLQATDVVLFVAGSILVAMNIQWASWFVVLAFYVLLPHLTATCDVYGWLKPKNEQPVFAPGEAAPPMAFLFTLVSVLCVWVAFALTPASNFLLGGKPRKLDRIHSSKTPLRVAAFLNQQDDSHPRIKGLVWAPEDWGDWLALAGDGRYALAMNSHLAALPARVLIDAAAVSRADSTWSKTLDRYGVEALVVDKERQPRLAEAVLGAGGSDWTTIYEDANSIVLRRREG